jgi:hypothetical protein
LLQRRVRNEPCGYQTAPCRGGITIVIARLLSGYGLWLLRLQAFENGLERLDLRR